MIGDRGDLEVETLVKIVLGLVILVLILEVVGEILEFGFWLLGPLRPLLWLVVVVLIVLWLADRR
jgi:hypothetical protein